MGSVHPLSLHYTKQHTYVEGIKAFPVNDGLCSNVIYIHLSKVLEGPFYARSAQKTLPLIMY